MADTIYLTTIEIKEISNLDLKTNLKLDRVRDMFIIGCYTGLRFSDIVNIKPEHINDGMIEITQVKTKEKVTIPIRPEVERLLSKYNNSLHKISNQKFNEYLYEVVKKCKGLEIEITKNAIQGGKQIIIKKPKSTTVVASTNIVRDFYKSYNKYVVEVSGKTYNILAYTEPNKDNIIKLKVSGNLFPTLTSYTENILIRPNDGVVDEFFNGLDDLEESILNRNSFPKYTSKFYVPRDGVNKTELIPVQYNWPISKDGWNLQITGLVYDQYLTDISDIADEIDDYKSNLFVRFLSSPQLFEFDTPDQKIQSIFQLYGQSFDIVKKYIDNIAYMRNVSYDGINNVPDILLKNLANTLGLDTIHLIDEKSLDELLYTKTSTQYSGLTSGTSLLDAEYEFYRRLLVNLSFIYKSKGTRQSLQFFLRFLGAPDPLIKINQYGYRVTSLPKTTDLSDDIYNSIAGTNVVTTTSFDPITYQYSLVTTTGGTSFNTDGYPVDPITLLPRSMSGSTDDVFFQMGSGWYDNTADHKSPTVVDTENSILTGRTKSVITKNSANTYGEDYFNLYRTLPGLDVGYGLQRNY